MPQTHCDIRLAPTQSRAETIIETVKTLLCELPPAEQQRALDEITAMFRPIRAHKAGEVLAAIVALLPTRPDWTAKELIAAVAGSGVQATPKNVYNALGYLTRKRKIWRAGYGRYSAGFRGRVAR